MGVTIVALPKDTSDVWRFSSEKVPHLTLLFLGDGVKDLSHVSEFVAHASTTLAPSYMGVKNRGVLGKDSADVLFFDKRWATRFDEFRQHLLTDPDIYQAYASIDQFPEWTPHLTMGYPKTPAKLVAKGEYVNLEFVDFDRIAIWTGDYEGVEFPLTAEDNVLSMVEKGAAYLEHYGVKGMKWGVVRSKLPGAAKSAVKAAYKPSGDALKARQIQTRAKLGGVRNLNNQEMQLVINRMRLEREYKELYGEKQWHNAGKKWASKFVTETLRDLTVSWLGRPAGGRRAPSPSAWNTGQQFANVLDGTIVPQKQLSR